MLNEITHNMADTAARSAGVPSVGPRFLQPPPAPGRRRLALGVALVLLTGIAAGTLAAAEGLTWRAEAQRMDAQVRDWPLPRLLRQIALQTGWEVYVEPGANLTVSARFRNLPVGEALRALLGNLNFALLPPSETRPRLFVFRSSMQEATQLVAAGNGDAAGERPPPRPIGNELIVKLKPGARIEELAEMLGAKVTGRIEELNTYRLEFESDEAAAAARKLLAANPGVGGLDENFSILAPPTPRALLASSLPNLQLKAKPPGDTSRVIIGLIDTAVQPLGGGLDAFVLPGISVVNEARLNPNQPAHGTTMAHTILNSLQATTQGSTSVQILPVDVYGDKPFTSTFDVARGIVQAVNAGANPINLSLGSDGDSALLREVIQSAARQGVRIYASAGNAPVTTPVYPAAYPEVTAVTAGTRSGEIAPYANRGSFVDVIAPGSSVVYFNGQPWYVAGTSTAAAYVTGLAAGLAERSNRDWNQVDAAVRLTFGARSPGNQ